MAKEKLLKKIKQTKAYLLFRKARYYLHLKPSFLKFKDFAVFYASGLIKRIEEHHVFLFAAGLAFSLFVCIIPFILIIFFVLGNILNSAQVQYQVNTLIETIIPYEQYADFVKRIIFSRINEVIQYKNIAGIIGGFGLLFAASGLFSSMRTILNKVFNVEVEEFFILAKLRDFALILMVVLIFFATTILLPFLEVIRNSATQLGILTFFNNVIFEHFLFTILSFSLLFVVFLIMYVTVPKVRLEKKANLISAFWAALLWEAAKQVFGYYIHNFTTLGRIYGTYAIIVVIAFWIYYSSIVFIIGAEIGKLYEERKYARNREMEIIEDDFKSKTHFN